MPEPTVLFTAAALSNAKDPQGAKALIQFLRTPEARAIIKAKGMEPVIR